MKLDAIVFAAGASSVAAASSPLWPKPVTEQLGDGHSTISSNFEFRHDQPSTFLDQAAARYQNLILSSVSSKNTPLSSQSVSISSCELHVDTLVEDEAATLQLNVDESYELSVTEDGICQISAPTVWGALHAMESFTQLLTRPDDEAHVSLDYLPVSITDSARFSHRGMLIDSSRHYLPVEEILRLVDSLPMSKFNVLHWHIVDAQSFPMDAPSAPRLVRGAYSPQATYSMSDIQQVVQYGSDRGVRVLLEIDVPGHAASWTKGYPEVMADCFIKYSYNINDFALNPTKEETYSLLQNVLKDASDATAVTGLGGLLHIGGDEVVYGCWNNDTSILEYMEEHSMDTDELLMMFAERADEMLREIKVTPVHWEEVFKAGAACGKQLNPADGSIFEVWTNKEQIQSIVQASFRVIAAPSDVWYLDHADNTWSVMYGYDPVMGLTTDEAQFIIGGEVAMWGEHVDESNIEGIIYPRAAAVGERLWSPEDVTDQDEAQGRLEIHRCRMKQRGIRPGALDPGYCSITYV
mmetsp:Transcript_17055/g.32111  ORF Transcript_17055/g.32111 Transcript_17055/m.32111 type:complete len:523 (+) Transcript_17055:42-1610(+)